MNPWCKPRSVFLGEILEPRTCSSPKKPQFTPESQTVFAREERREDKTPSSDALCEDAHRLLWESGNEAGESWRKVADPSQMKEDLARELESRGLPLPEGDYYVVKRPDSLQTQEREEKRMTSSPSRKTRQVANSPNYSKRFSETPVTPSSPDSWTRWSPTTA